MLQTFIFGIAMCLFIYMICRRLKYYLIHFQVPGPVGYPLVGMAYKFIKSENILSTLGEYENKYGGVAFSWLGPVPFLVISDPQAARDVLTSPSCVNKGVVYNALSDYIGDGLFTSKDPQWSAHRKLLNPAFSHKALLNFIPIFNEEADKLVMNLTELSETKQQNIMHIVQVASLNTAARTTLNLNFSSQDGSKHEHLINSFQCILKRVTQISFSPLVMCKSLRFQGSKYLSAKNQICNLTKSIVHEALDARSSDAEQNDNSKNTSFINFAMPLHIEGSLSLQNLEDETNAILFGAFETTANTIAYTLILLAMFPNYQKKVFEEIIAYFPNQGRFEVTHEDIMQLTYLDMILKETMRLMAPVPLIARQVMSNLQLSNGVIIPKGVQIAIDIFHIQRNEQIWGPNASTFDPDHFLPYNLENKHPFSFIPFTKGTRTCIGWKYAMLSIKIKLIKLIRNYQFATEFKFDDLCFLENITIKLKKTPLLDIVKR